MTGPTHKVDYPSLSITGLSPSLVPLSIGFFWLSEVNGLVPFRSPLLRESLLLSFPPVT